jgi:hypothetical protein
MTQSLSPCNFTILNIKAIPVQAYYKSIDFQVIGGFQISRQLAHEDGKLVSRTRRPALAPSPREYT